MKGVVKSQMEAVGDIDLWELAASFFYRFPSHFTVIFRMLCRKKLLDLSNFILKLKMNINLLKLRE